jgi:hypothetical protein
MKLEGINLAPKQPRAEEQIQAVRLTGWWGLLPPLLVALAIDHAVIEPFVRALLATPLR